MSIEAKQRKVLGLLGSCKMTQEQLAQEAGVKQSTVSKTWPRLMRSA